jgi:hypothetical protein
MNKINHLAVLIAALGAFTAHAQLQTLVDGNTTIEVASNSYAVIEKAQTYSDGDLRVIAHGVTFDFAFGDTAVNGYTFTGPATIQFPNGVSNPTFATVNVASLRKAIGTNIQTLVVSPDNTNSATITVPTNSYAIINSADTQSSATLLVTIQGTTFTFALQDVSVKNLTFAGPATIQLQGDTYGPSFTTVDVMPLRKSSKTQIQTLVVTTTNTTSPALSVSSTQYALIKSVVTETGTLNATVGGVSLNFNDLQDESAVGFKFAGPATLQLQGNTFTPSFMTVEVGPNK